MKTEQQYNALFREVHALEEVLSDVGTLDQVGVVSMGYQPQEGLSEVSAEMMTLSFEHIQKRLGLSGQKMVSIEHFFSPLTRVPATEIAMETIVDTITAALARIKEFFIDLFKKLVAFFKGNRYGIEKAKDSLRHLATRTDQLPTNHEDARITATDCTKYFHLTSPNPNVYVDDILRILEMPGHLLHALERYFEAQSFLSQFPSELDEKFFKDGELVKHGAALARLTALSEKAAEAFLHEIPNDCFLEKNIPSSSLSSIAHGAAGAEGLYDKIGYLYKNYCLTVTVKAGGSKLKSNTNVMIFFNISLDEDTDHPAEDFTDFKTPNKEQINLIKSKIADLILQTDKLDRLKGHVEQSVKNISSAMDRLIDATSRLKTAPEYRQDLTVAFSHIRKYYTDYGMNVMKAIGIISKLESLGIANGLQFVDLILRQLESENTKE